MRPGAAWVCEVAEPAVWSELAAVVPIEEHTVEVLSPTRRRVDAAFAEGAVAALGAAGIGVLVRYARRAPGDPGGDESLGERLAALSRRARRVLHVAQRHAVAGMVVGSAWDPESDAAVVRELLSAGMIERHPEGDGVRFLLHPDLPPPPAVPYALGEAVMDAPDDLGPPAAGPVALLHDLASLAAAIEAERPKRTLAGHLAAADARRMAARLAVPGVHIEDDARWGRALRALEALGVVTTDFVRRDLSLDPALEEVLAGGTEDAVDRLLHRLVDADLHSAVPAVRAALREAGAGAVDEVVFVDLLFEQHRDVLFSPWQGGRGPVYPGGDGRPFDRDGFDAVEVPMIHRLLRRLAKLGVVRTAPGVFAATDDGLRWAAPADQPMPPVWVSSDLEVIVGPGSVTPWERFQLERLGRCLGRDVVDRYRLEREALARWLRFHTVDEALALLSRRCPALPATAAQTLGAWARSVSRVVLTVG